MGKTANINVVLMVAKHQAKAAGCEDFVEPFLVEASKSLDDLLSSGVRRILVSKDGIRAF